MLKNNELILHVMLVNINIKFLELKTVLKWTNLEKRNIYSSVSVCFQLKQVIKKSYLSDNLYS